MSKTVSIFGATGTLGAAALDVVKLHPDVFTLDTLTSHSRDLEAFDAPHKIEVERDGEDALIEAAQRPVDLVIMAISGMAALKPTLAAIRAGRTIAFASKEALVSAGSLMMAEAARHGATLLPLDSEHNAIFQCWGDNVERIVLTASGGPFLNTPRASLSAITPQQAVAHPKWSMGPKISVDSATMMNKGLEVIEAHHLFNLPSEKIDVLIHPQSLVHGMVEYADGSVLCQMGPSDMRTAMTNVMFWPQRGATPGPKLSLNDMKTLEFRELDVAQFPAMTLCREALKAGQGACVVLNAANEVAVAAFLDGRIRFHLALRPEDEASFHEKKLREIVLSRTGNNQFELSFWFSAASPDDTDPPSADKTGEIPEYIMVEETT